MRERDRGAALASSSTLNRLELGDPEQAAAHRYKRIVAQPEALDDRLVGLFVGSHGKPPREIWLDLDAAGAIEELERIVGQLRRAWPKTRIVLRGDSGFCREALMRWCEVHAVDYLFGLTRNERLVGHDDQVGARRRRRGPVRERWVRVAAVEDMANPRSARVVRIAGVTAVSSGRRPWLRSSTRWQSASRRPVRADSAAAAHFAPGTGSPEVEGVRRRDGGTWDGRNRFRLRVAGRSSGRSGRV